MHNLHGKHAQTSVKISFSHHTNYHASQIFASSSTSASAHHNTADKMVASNALHIAFPVHRSGMRTPNNDPYLSHEHHASPY